MSLVWTGLYIKFNSYVVYATQVHCHSDIKLRAYEGQAVTRWHKQLGLYEAQEIPLDQQLHLSHSEIQPAVCGDSKQISVPLNIRLCEKVAPLESCLLLTLWSNLIKTVSYR